MEPLLESLKQFFTDIPGFLTGFVEAHGLWVYGLLFAIIFAETGLVLLPFLPGDSLLFTVGALSVPSKETGKAAFDVWLVSGVMIVAAILGDAVNYHIGHYVGPRVFNKSPDPNHKPSTLERALNRQHLDRAHAFFDKYGGKAVILGRFVPIVRTFVPFVAGAGAMSYGKFFLYNVVGAVVWVGVCVGAGVLFGNIPFVKKNFELVVIAIIVVSVLPVVYEVIVAKVEARRAAAK